MTHILTSDNVTCTEFYNNGYNGGATFEIKSNGSKYTVDLDGAEIVLKNRPLGCLLFQLTDHDDGFFDVESCPEHAQYFYTDEDGDECYTKEAVEMMTASKLEVLADYAVNDDLISTAILAAMAELDE